MPRELDELTDEELENHVRARVSPQMVEWLHRKEDEIARLSPLSAVTDAAFGALVGSQNTLKDLVEELQRLLTEATNPEYRTDDGLSL